MSLESGTSCPQTRHGCSMPPASRSQWQRSSASIGTASASLPKMRLHGLIEPVTPSTVHRIRAQLVAVAAPMRARMPATATVMMAAPARSFRRHLRVFFFLSREKAHTASLASSSHPPLAPRRDVLRRLRGRTRGGPGGGRRRRARVVVGRVRPGHRGGRDAERRAARVHPPQVRGQALAGPGRRRPRTSPGWSCCRPCMESATATRTSGSSI